MAYLTGETTWNDVLTKISDLVTGAVADDLGTTVPVGSRWRNLYNDATNGIILAAPASQEIVESQEHRAGYWARTDDNTIWRDISDTYTQYLRQTAMVSAFTSANFRDVLNFTAQVVTPNTTPHDYSTAVIRFRATVTSQASGGAALLSGSNVTLNAAGQGTLTFSGLTTGGITMSFEAKNPTTGILRPGAIYHRIFTAEFRGGIDHWRNFEKANANPTFPTAPPGAQGVDWDHTLGRTSTRSVYTSSTSYYEAIGNNDIVYWYPANGMGIKTNTALSGGRYEVSYGWTDSTHRFYKTGTAINCQWGQTAVDYNGTTRHFGVGGSHGNVFKFVDPFGTTPIAASRVQYFISVTETHLAIILNGDSNYSGRVSGNLLAKVVVDNPSLDRGCWFRGYLDSGTAGSTSHSKNWYRCGAHQLVERVSVKGYHDGGRDWQSGTGRLDIMPGGWGSMISGELGWCFFSSTQRTNRMTHTDAQTTNYHDSIPTNGNRVTVPVYADPRWPLEGFTLNDYTLITDELGNNLPHQTYAGLYRPRGYVAEGIWYSPYYQFAEGDELLDTETSKRYKLFTNRNWMVAGSNDVSAVPVLEMF